MGMKMFRYEKGTERHEIEGEPRESGQRVLATRFDECEVAYQCDTFKPPL